MIVERDGSLMIEGPMTINQAASLLQVGQPMVGTADLCLDFKAVTVVDSSALAVVLEFQRAARKAGRRLDLVNLPPSFSSLAMLYGVDGLFVNSPGK